MRERHPRTDPVRLVPALPQHLHRRVFAWLGPRGLAALLRCVLADRFVWYLLAPHAGRTDAAPSSRVSPTGGQLQRSRPGPVLGDGEAGGRRRRRRQRTVRRDARLPGPILALRRRRLPRRESERPFAYISIYNCISIKYSINIMYHSVVLLYRYECIYVRIFNATETIMN